jgi:hypothetical protein
VNDDMGEFYASIWADVKQLICKFHTCIVNAASNDDGVSLAGTNLMYQTVGCDHKCRNVYQRLAVKLYGLWVVNPYDAKEWFMEWVDEELDKDDPEDFPE